MNYAGLTPYLVKAVQDIAAISNTFKTNLVAWFANAQNGIGDLFATAIHAHTVTADQLCAGNVCVNQQQLAALLCAAASGSQVTNSGNATSSGAASTTSSGAAGGAAPIISVSGNNPATVNVGDVYNDLGATITAPQADLNLGLTIVVDGATSTSGTVQLDTSVPGTHTILYTVTDPAGLTASSMRTVNVVLPTPQMMATTTSATSTLL
jgi:hypothetical protein